MFGLAVTDNGSPPASSSQRSPGAATRSSSGWIAWWAALRTFRKRGPDNGGRRSEHRRCGAASRMANRTERHGPGLRHHSRTRALAGCLGLPVSHVGIVSGTTEPGGPQVASSGWFASPIGSASAFESYVVLTRAVTTEQSDVAALTARPGSSCMQGWFASLDQSGDQIVGVPIVSAVPIAVMSGERAVGFSAAVVTRINGAEVQVNEELVVLGAGRVEVGLVSESKAALMPSSVESSQLNGLEHRLKVGHHPS